MKLSVCSWSYRLSAAKVAEEMTKSQINHVQLALCPFVDPNAVVPGSVGETSGGAGTGGVDSIEKQRADVESYLASGRWQLSATMFNSRYEDYTTLETIKRTGGIVPDEHWEENLKVFTAAAKLSAQWKSPYLMLHAGTADHADKAAVAKLTDRLKRLRDICANEGIGMTLETGQETAEELAEMLTNLPGVYVNFDPANMILYGKGNPVEAVKILAPWIRHIHVKDADYSKVPGEWGCEKAWTEGQVNAGAFIDALKAVNFDGALAIEREAGDDRAGDIARALEDLKGRNV